MFLQQVPDNLGDRLSMTRLTHLTPPSAGRPYGVRRELWHPYLLFGCETFRRKPYTCPFGAFPPHRRLVCLAYAEALLESH